MIVVVVVVVVVVIVLVVVVVVARLARVGVRGRLWASVVRWRE